eukprot:CAMPEP_0169139350 /NCGR_PEP_ID=MMETSP1015-20121227/42911_1 /TAXON_ID=342587 /ORGANISM="Karlodinium micrum, Strain CCMP2283" /LENGTH=300 /DNA_ID=CAMNT_0009205027 /DNA_START=77 /DNA_END=979 /DNA_ORIENTATION=+
MDPALQSNVKRRSELRYDCLRRLSSNSGVRQHVSPRLQNEPLVDTRETLESMKQSALQRRATDLGAAADEVEAAIDDDANPKGALIDLILSRQAPLSQKDGEIVQKEDAFDFGAEALPKKEEDAFDFGSEALPKPKGDKTETSGQTLESPFDFADESVPKKDDESEYSIEDQIADAFAAKMRGEDLGYYEKTEKPELTRGDVLSIGFAATLAIAGGYRILNPVYDQVPLINQNDVALSAKMETANQIAARARAVGLPSTGYFDLKDAPVGSAGWYMLKEQEGLTEEEAEAELERLSPGMR